MYTLTLSHYLPYAIAAIVIFTIYMAAVNLFRRDRMQERLRASADNRMMGSDRDDTPPVFATFCSGLLAIFGVNVKQQKELAVQLAQAGIVSPYGVTYYLFFSRIVQPLLLLAGAAVVAKLLLFSPDATKSGKLLMIIIAFLLLVIGARGAHLYVSNRRQHRQVLLLRSFPEALDLLLVCIESGLGLDAALSRVSKELRLNRPVVSDELERTRIELTMMSDRVQALQNLAERTGITAFRSLVASLIQTERFGTSLVDTLRVLSDDQRVTRLLTAENKAARIPVIISIPLILCIMPALFIVILAPPFIRASANGGLLGPANSGN